MAHRSLEETIATIAPSRERGIPNAPTLSVGVSSDNGDLTNALSQAGQQIQQLQTAYQQQADLITQNTQALQGNTSAHGSSAGSTLGSIASNLFGGALGFLSPIISGIASLFGGSSTPAALPVYKAPPPVSINGVLQSPAASTAQTGDATTSVSTPAAGTLSPAGQQVAQLQQSVSNPSQPNALALNTVSTTGDTVNSQTANNVTNLLGSSDGSGAALGYLSQIASALTNPGGAGSSVSTQLPIYTPPAGRSRKRRTPAAIRCHAAPKRFVCFRPVRLWQHAIERRAANHRERERDGQPVFHGPQRRHRQCRTRRHAQYASH